MRGGVYNANIGRVYSKTVSERHLEATSLQVDVLSGKQIGRCLLFLRIVMISIYVGALRLILISSIRIEVTSANTET